MLSRPDLIFLLQEDLKFDVHIYGLSEKGMFDNCDIFCVFFTIVILISMCQGVEPSTTFENLGLPSEWYDALEWVYPTWLRAHALDPGKAVNILKGAIVTADRLVTVSQVQDFLPMYYLFFSY